jgi:hypothetical protein
MAHGELHDLGLSRKAVVAVLVKSVAAARRCSAR